MTGAITSTVATTSLLRTQAEQIAVPSAAAQAVETTPAVNPISVNDISIQIAQSPGGQVPVVQVLSSETGDVLSQFPSDALIEIFATVQSDALSDFDAEIIGELLNDIAPGGAAGESEAPQSSVIENAQPNTEQSAAQVNAEAIARDQLLAAISVLITDPQTSSQATRLLNTLV